MKSLESVESQQNGSKMGFSPNFKNKIGTVSLKSLVYPDFLCRIKIFKEKNLVMLLDNYSTFF